MAVGRVLDGFRGLTKKYLERGVIARIHERPPVKPRLETPYTQGQLVAARLGLCNVLVDEGFEQHRRSDVGFLNNRRDTREDLSEAPRQGGTLAGNTANLAPGKRIINLNLLTLGRKWV